ncbi:MAG: NAD(P)/FAD-dependent oxidoreductase [Planctomycetota bacterium]
MDSTARSPGGEFDAVIVGAGSAGLMAAWTLGQAGWNTLLVERHRELPRSVCGEYLSPAGVRTVRDAGLSDLLSGWKPVHGMRLVSPAGRVVPCFFPEESPGGLSVDKRRFHEALLEQAVASGVSVEFGATATVAAAPARSEQEWCIALGSGDRGSVVRTRLLLAADGRRSSIARSAGLALELGRHARGRIAIRGFVEFEGEPERLGEMHVLIGGAYVGVNPVQRDEVNVSLVCGRDQVRECGGPSQALADHIDRATDLRSRVVSGSLREVRGVTPISSRVRSPVAVGLALLGDAGGFVDPLTGEGITVALATGRAAALAVIDGRRRGDDLQSALQRYARERRKMYRAKSGVSLAFQWIIRRPWVCEAIGGYLEADERRRRGFIGVVGNDYTPIAGLLSMCGLDPRGAGFGVRRRSDRG